MKLRCNVGVSTPSPISTTLLTFVGLLLSVMSCKSTPKNPEPQALSVNDCESPLDFLARQSSASGNWERARRSFVYDLSLPRNSAEYLALNAQGVLTLGTQAPTPEGPEVPGAGASSQAQVLLDFITDSPERSAYRLDCYRWIRPTLDESIYPSPTKIRRVALQTFSCLVPYAFLLKTGEFVARWIPAPSQGGSTGSAIFPLFKTPVALKIPHPDVAHRLPDPGQKVEERVVLNLMAARNCFLPPGEGISQYRLEVLK